MLMRKGKIRVSPKTTHSSHLLYSCACVATEFTTAFFSFILAHFAHTETHGTESLCEFSLLIQRIFTGLYKHRFQPLGDPTDLTVLFPARTTEPLDPQGSQLFHTYTSTLPHNPYRAGGAPAAWRWPPRWWTYPQLVAVQGQPLRGPPLIRTTS